jgi:hypothetical protein
MTSIPAFLPLVSVARSVRAQQQTGASHGGSIPLVP